MAASTAARTKAIGIPVANKAPSVSGKSALVVPVGSPPDVVNRNALEQRAGKDAGKLLVRSTPSGARIWINGMFVGNTPLLLILAPGQYQVEVQAQRFESARQEVALLPRETREMALRMAVRYPTTVSIR